MCILIKANRNKGRHETGDSSIVSVRSFDLDKYLMNNPIREMIQRKFVGEVSVILSRIFGDLNRTDLWARST